MHQHLDRSLVTLGGFQLLVMCSAVSALPSCGARTSLLDENSWGRKSATGNPALAAGGAGAGGVGAVGGANSHAGAANTLDAGVAGASPMPCEAATVSLDALRPAVTLLVDQSISMGTPYPTADSPETRWSLMGAALFDPSNGVVKTYQGSVRFGIAFFTAYSFRGGACPVLNEAPAATNNYEALNALYQGLAPSGTTPTGESIDQIVSEIKASGSASQQSIVLVTDGDPNTCANPFPQNNDGQPVAVAAAQNAYAAGIDLYVLGISDDIAGSNLQQLANAGKGKPIDLQWGVDADAAQPYLAGSNAVGLTNQFADILAKIPFCEVRLQRDIAPSELNTARVMLDGQSIPLSPRNGYALKDPRHLELIGSACTAIKSGAKQLSVRISCD